MLNHGLPVIVVSRMVGFAKPFFTLDVNSHLLPSMQIEAAEFAVGIHVSGVLLRWHDIRPIENRFFQL
jgi:hypothetical protein